MHIRDTLLGITSGVKKTSADLFATTKLNMAIASNQGAIKNIHAQMGAAVHELYKGGASLGAEFDEMYAKICACEEKIADLRQKLSLVKGVQLCVPCGNMTAIGSEFCPKCGARLCDTAEAISDTPLANSPACETDAPPNVSPDSVVCRVCNTENDSHTKFCDSCGRILG